MIHANGFLCGWVGSVGGTLSGRQRSARRQGKPEPTSIAGKKGQGRASTSRSYTVTVQRVSDGRVLEETVGPAYWSKRRWQKEQEDAQRRMLAELGWKG